MGFQFVGCVKRTTVARDWCVSRTLHLSQQPPQQLQARAKMVRRPRTAHFQQQPAWAEISCRIRRTASNHPSCTDDGSRNAALKTISSLRPVRSAGNVRMRQQCSALADNRSSTVRSVCCTAARTSRRRSNSAFFPAEVVLHPCAGRPDNAEEADRHDRPSCSVLDLPEGRA